MNCVNHPEQPAVAFCRTCGKALCVNCQRPVQGTVFCEEHFPAAAGSPYPVLTGRPRTVIPLIQATRARIRRIRECRPVSLSYWA